MKTHSKAAIAPNLRFPDFRNEPGWDVTPLGSVLTEHGIKNDGASEVHSVSVHKGVVNQVKHLGRSFAGSDLSNYNLAKPHDIIYTKSPTGDFPFGIVKQNKLPYNVIVSPLYGVFSPSNRHLGYILDAYFESPVRAKNYLAPITQKGAKNTIQITNATFLSKGLYLPSNEDEHKKIAQLLRTLDELIKIENRKLRAFKAHKRGLTQHLFPRDGEALPRVRFPEFQNDPPWEKQTLAGIAEISAGTTPARAKLENYIGGSIPWVKTGDLNNSFITHTEECVTPLAKVRINPPGSVLVAMYGGFNQIGRTGCLSIPAATNQAISVLSVDKSVATPTYVLAWLNAKVGTWKRIAGSSRKDPNITGSDVGRFSILVPKIPEQQRIASCLSSLDEMIAAQDAKVECLRAHKQGLLQQIFPHSPEPQV